MCVSPRHLQRCRYGVKFKSSSCFCPTLYFRLPLSASAIHCSLLISTYCTVRTLVKTSGPWWTKGCTVHAVLPTFCVRPRTIGRSLPSESLTCHFAAHSVFLARGSDFCRAQRFQTDPGDHPASYWGGFRCFGVGGGGGVDHSPSSSAEVEKALTTVCLHFNVRRNGVAF